MQFPLQIYCGPTRLTVKWNSEVFRAPGVWSWDCLVAWWGSVVLSSVRKENLTALAPKKVPELSAQTSLPGMTQWYIALFEITCGVGLFFCERILGTCVCVCLRDAFWCVGLRMGRRMGELERTCPCPLWEAAEFHPVEQFHLGRFNCCLFFFCFWSFWYRPFSQVWSTISLFIFTFLW